MHPFPHYLLESLAHKQIALLQMKNSAGLMAFGVICLECEIRALVECLNVYYRTAKCA